MSHSSLTLLKQKTTLSYIIYILLLNKKYWIFFLFDIIYKHSKRLVKITKKAYVVSNSEFSFSTYVTNNFVFRTVSLNVFKKIHTLFKKINILTIYFFIKQLFKIIKSTLLKFCNKLVPNKIYNNSKQNNQLFNNKLSFYMSYKLNILNLNMMNIYNYYNIRTYILPLNKIYISRTHNTNNIKSIINVYAHKHLLYFNNNNTFLLYKLFNILQLIYQSEYNKINNCFFYSALEYKLKDNNVLNNNISIVFDKVILMNENKYVHNSKPLPSSLSLFLKSESISYVITKKIYTFLLRKKLFFSYKKWLFLCSYFYKKIVHLQMFFKMFSSIINIDIYQLRTYKYFLLDNEFSYLNILKKYNIHEYSYNINFDTNIINKVNRTGEIGSSIKSLIRNAVKHSNTRFKKKNVLFK